MTYFRRKIGKHLIVSLTEEDLHIAIPMLIGTVMMLSTVLITL